MINEINFPTIAGGFLNNKVIKDRKQVFKGIEQTELTLQRAMKSQCQIAQILVGQLTI